MRSNIPSPRRLPLYALLVGTLSPFATNAAEPPAYEYDDDEVVVTTQRPARPLVTNIDPERAQQPVPSADGAGLLKSVPGFTVIRKGGVSGDPLLRGLGGSRLNILADGGNVFGGCGGRMDPPTAYLYPDSYDNVRIVKGPQTVTDGPGIIAGVVSFERKPLHFDSAGVKFSGEALFGSAERNDQAADVALGDEHFYTRFIGTHSRASDYQDGDGQTVHSRYHRESGTAVVGLTPNATTRIEVTGDVSRGQAAYADRGMDGAKFDRDAYGLLFEKKALAAWLPRIAARFNHSYVDHVMDNFSLRAAPRMKMLGNPDRATDSARVSAELAPIDTMSLTIGADWQRDRHTSRGGLAYLSQPRQRDQTFDSYGLFAEGRYWINPHGEVISGIRRDEQRITFNKMPVANPQRDQRYGVTAAFARYEHHWSNAVTLFAGLGHAGRAPDYWERSRNPGLRPEANTQIDAGWLYSGGTWRASLSAFASDISDFILIDNRSATKARNIHARRYGFEAEASWQFARHWKTGAALSMAYGNNLTDGLPLAQTPPLDGRVSVSYDNGTYAAAVLVRGVMAQHRVAAGQGNIAGVDIGPASGFGVVSLNGGWRINKRATLTAGVDNIFNKTYAEPISRGGVSVPGYQVTQRVNEPGRTLWLQGSIKF